MNSTVKTIALWILILVAAVGLYNLVESKGTGAKPPLDLTQFFEKVSKGEVADVEINGTKVTGHLVAGNEAFQSTIPLEYKTVYDRLTEKGVKVTVLPTETNSWVNAVPSWVMLIGSILWLGISIMVFVLVADLSRFVKRELRRGGHDTSTV
jgi:cell division protease FtsH